MQIPHFKFYNKQDVLYLTRLRRFETKIGERIRVLTSTDQFEENLHQAPVEYVVFGIPEDIGVKANYGRGGADSAWLPFLTAFLNMQSNDFCTGEEMLLLGHFDFGDLQYLIENHAKGEEEKVEAYRHAVHQIDEEVETLTKQILAAGKIPIVIGGGHNNAYPLIKGAAKGLHKTGRLPLAQINTINLDAHTDFRPAEGRHSGNGFRYAEEDGYLQKYCVIGVQENYLQQNVWLDFVNNPFLDMITYEDIFLHEKRNFRQAVTHATGFTEDNYCGVELDLDVIEHALSSAVTPAGITALQARQYISLAGVYTQPAYLHICEGATQLSDGSKSNSTGKLISYLVSDFIKARNDVKGR
ncbi:formimidoylglutamase [Flavihumibacter petaseus]|uniref:Putative hydrolase n=1 Tax=Flavihumibacter petaseus NBRC 106054 TaxID=1220578 RepID=A0A0E9N760_9BACT|nr:formimidoylglutamase [Flavihumibacter petaseus]GAO45664.1 putative hydrolase [Flavihumibacter petaseus NBRC 106054]